MNRPAQYLLRFDDLCPTFAADRWRRFVPLIAEFGIKPILAVVPDNRDRELEFSPPSPDFWAEMRALEAAGAMIALHGYRHLNNSEARGWLPLHRKTEFAGVPQEKQREWISSGLKILRGHGLDPRIWVAPRHGFDRNTLLALRQEGIGVLSDGLARVPFTRGGVVWIPQQLWEPVAKSQGLWTICIHSNSARNSQVEQLRVFLGQHAAKFTSVERVLREFKPQRLGIMEDLRAKMVLWRFLASRARKRLRHRI